MMMMITIMMMRMRKNLMKMMMMMMMMMITRSLSNTAIQTAQMTRKKSRLMRSLDGQHGRRYLQFGNVKTSSANHAKLHRATQPLLIFPMKISANRSELSQNRGRTAIFSTICLRIGADI